MPCAVTSKRNVLTDLSPVSGHISGIIIGSGFGVVMCGREGVLWCKSVLRRNHAATAVKLTALTGYRECKTAADKAATMIINDAG